MANFACLAKMPNISDSTNKVLKVATNKLSSAKMN